MLATALLLLTALAADAEPKGPVEADLVIRGATIHDGSGQDAVVADVAVRGRRIVAVGEFEVRGEPREIEAAGMIVAPGFIDLHSHSDRTITEEKTRGNVNFLMQGCTSVLTGNCGGGKLDVEKYLRDVDEHGAGTNVLHLVPQGALRSSVVGSVNRPPSPAELKEMQRQLDEALTAGAWGMSSGLIYLPSRYADTDELVELSRVVARHDGIYATHMRNEGSQVLEAIEEALEIGRRSEARLHISHFKVSGPSAWGLARDAVELVREARGAGQVVTADQYPYTASSTSLAAMTLPADVRSKEEIEAATADPNRRTDLYDAIDAALARRGGPQRLVVADYKVDRTWQGKNLADLAAEQKRDVRDLILEIQRGGGASMVNFGMSEEEVRLIMQQSFVATASDGSARDARAETKPHPRSYGTFPRKIGRYAIAGKTVSVAQAIRSASGLPADILKLPHRGYLRPGYAADIVVFDPATFRDTATFEDPHQFATGVRYVLVNGRLAVSEGKPTGELHGRAIRRQ
ncbi:MAG: D-aminoacylase [Pirellulaceae bacterium]